ncbi:MULTISPECIES: gluconokinase [Rhizobium/Agrobacterium group]|uniref:gluconokinase n=1 Tax=Rhizobium/Agrobacterium group TaxID=227290 RepID=UPI000AC27FF6|nr:MULTISPECIES: gluconokinase [Rhizobium/Agrobacterium group]
MTAFEPSPSISFGSVTVVIGVSGCGKSTVAKRLAEEVGWRFLEGDTLHPEANILKMRRGIPLSDDDRLPWLERIADELLSASDKGEGIVASCSALKFIYRERLRDRLGRRLNFVFLNASYEALSIRLGGRTNHFMPPSLLRSQFATLETPAGEPDAYEVNAELGIEDILDCVRALFTKKGRITGYGAR